MKILIHYPHVLNVCSFYLDACLIIYMILSNYLSYCQLPCTACGHIPSVLPLWKSYGKTGPLWSVRCLNYLDPQEGPPAVLASTSTDSGGLRSNFMNSMGSTCCYNWKQLPSGLLWSFSLRWESTYNQHGHIVTMVTILLNGNPERS